MNIYKFKNYTYSTNDLFFDKPCEVRGVVIYPIKAKEYEDFLQYASYLMFSKKHLKIEKADIDLLNALIILMADAKGGIEEEINTVLIEMCNLFSILTHKEIKVISTENGFEFIDEEKTLVINKDNFNTIRKVVLKMALLTEPKIYEREIDRKWDEKVRIAHQKGNPQLEFGEIVLIVSQDMKYTIEQTLDLNIFQLKSYYMRIMQIYESETTRLFATVSPDCKPTPFAKNIFEELYKNHDEDYNINTKDFEKKLK